MIEQSHLDLVTKKKKWILDLRKIIERIELDGNLDHVHEFYLRYKEGKKRKLENEILKHYWSLRKM